MYRVARRIGISLVCCGLVLGMLQSSHAEDASTERGGAHTDPAAIEAAIHALKPPIESERLTQILDGLSGLTDSAEQQRLQQLLDAQMQEVMEVAPPEGVIAPPSTATDSSVPPPAQLLSDDEIGLRIQTLKLGPEATADDLRARDEVVTAIVALRDPVKRDRFFQLLEERERQTQTAVYRPTDSSHQ